MPIGSFLSFVSIVNLFENIREVKGFRSIDKTNVSDYTAHGNILSNCNGLEPVIPGTFKLSPYVSTCLRVIARAIAQCRQIKP